MAGNKDIGEYNVLNYQSFYFRLNLAHPPFRGG
jgi:hypothetical protein